MHALNLSEQEQEPRPLKQRGVLLSLSSSLIIHWHSTDILCRAFNEILKVDRATYGGEEEYEIADTLPDVWQQRVDDVVAGTVTDTDIVW